MVWSELLSLDAGIDFFRRHALEGIQQQHAGRRLETIGDEQGIDGMIAGHVPAMLDAVLAAREVRQGAMQRLVGQHELGFFQRQRGDVGRVIVKLARIGRRSGTPFLARRHHRQAQGQRAEKRLVQDQPGAGRGEFGFD